MAEKRSATNYPGNSPKKFKSGVRGAAHLGLSGRGGGTPGGPLDPPTFNIFQQLENLWREMSKNHRKVSRKKVSFFYLLKILKNIYRGFREK